jgi:hypothetical protein
LRGPNTREWHVRTMGQVLRLRLTIAYNGLDDPLNPLNHIDCRVVMVNSGFIQKIPSWLVTETGFLLLQLLQLRDYLQHKK